MKASSFALLSALLATQVTVAANLNSKPVDSKWLAAALELQRGIDMDAPLNEATFLGTHNSYNSKKYQIPLVRYVDPNQTLSLYEQLEAGVRSVELDAHWTLTKKASYDVLLCHGLANHVGCSPFDRKFSEGLQELQDWLKANPKEIVLLYIERHLDGHEPRLAALLDEYLGKYIYSPASQRVDKEDKSCVALPTALTKSAILKAGKQLVIVTKGCDAGKSYKEENKFTQHWNNVVFAGIGEIASDPFTFIDSTMNGWTPFPDCGKNIFESDTKHSSLWRIFEDRTTLSSIEKSQRELTADDMSELTHCGINWPAMDMLEKNDPRLAAAVWSWAPGYPKEKAGNCAIYKDNEGIENLACDKFSQGYVCRKENSLEFKAVTLAGIWNAGEATCQALAGKEWHFSTPINGRQMDMVKAEVKKSGLAEVWLSYVKS